MKKKDVYNPRTDHAILKFKVVPRFQDVAECKLAIRKWAIHKGYNIWFEKRNRR